MTKSNMETLTDALQNVGIHMLGTANASVMSRTYATRAVAGFELVPRYKVSLAEADPVAAVDVKWNNVAHELHIYSAASELILGFPGIYYSLGWLRAHDSRGSNLPSRILAATGTLEFTALSNDGHRLSAVSKEEYEYWIIGKSFTEEQIQLGTAAEKKASDTEGRLRELVESGAEFREIIDFIGRESMHGPLQKLVVAGMLKQACGIPIDRARKIAAMVNYSTGDFIEPADRVEEEWQRIVFDHLR